MAYTRTNWVNNTTPIDNTNLNKIEQGIYDNSLVADAVNATVKPTGETYKSQTLTEGQITEVLGVSNIILKGDTVQDGTPTPSAPVEVQVVKGNVEVKVENINILNPYEMFENQINAGLIQIQSDGKIILNGTFDSSNRNLKKIKLKAGTYNGIEKLQIVHFFWLGPDGFLQRNSSITLNEDKEIQGHISNGTYDNVELQPMIYTGNYVANKSYTPHQGQTLPLTLGDIELCKVGNYQDYFYKSGNDWYLHKEVGKVVLDGTENWMIENENTRFGYYPQSTGSISPASTTGFCSQYGVYDRYAGTVNSFGVGTNSIRCYNDNNLSLADFKSSLATNNLIIYFEATATNTEITDTTLKAQLEAIYNAPLYEQTNITQENNDLPIILDITAFKDNINGIKAWIRK